MTTATEWDYSTLAAFYDNRAEYDDRAIDAAVAAMCLVPGDVVADIGAGTGKLARPMAERGLVVRAVEPNDEMRRHGMNNTVRLSVSWRAGTGERTGLADASARAVTFGSSFNVVDQPATLRECRRIVEARGWFCCLWNHRDLDDPLQARIEDLIRAAVPDYQYGSRRQDPTAVLTASGLFDPIQPFASSFMTVMSREAVMDAWRSHGTLARQAGPAFGAVIDAIAAALETDEVRVPVHDPGLARAIQVSAHMGTVGSEGTVWWITGLSGAGKSTVGALVRDGVRACGRQALLLDGDVLREVLGETGAYDTADRQRLAMTYARLAREVARQGIDAVCATISMFHAVRAWNRLHIPHYREIYLRVPLAELRRRDPKGLYDRACATSECSLVGNDGCCEEPDAPDLVIDNFGTVDPRAAAERILVLGAQ